VRALADFKANRVTALVATEVAGPRLDIKELPHVVNYELPNVPILRAPHRSHGACRWLRFGRLAGVAG